MAKSNKKVRSNRINALRKQYDAFLEEDKKRRDRNEFILGRLEKMRLGSPAPTSVYHENTQVVIKPVSQRTDFLNKLWCRDTNKNTILDQSVTLPDYNKNLEETTILKEISKKFILIPKLQSALHNNITYPSIENIKDTDWRSKYNILDELKRNEKETTHEKSDYVFGSTEDHKTTRCMETPSLSQFDPPVLDDCIKPPPKDLSNESVTNIVSKDETPYSEIKQNLCMSNQNKNAKDNLIIPEENIESNQRMVEQTEIPIKNTKHFEANGMPEDNKIINEIQEQTNVGLDNKNSVERNNNRYDTPAESRLQPKIEENTDTSHEIHESNISDNFDNDMNPQEIIKEKVINASDNSSLEINNDQDNSTANAQQQPLQLHQQTVQQSVKEIPYPEINQELISKDKVDVTEAFQENIEETENNDVLLNNPDNYESNEAHEQHTNVEVNNENNYEVTYAEGDKNYANSQENNESENYADNEHYKNEYAYYDESQQGEPYVGEINEHVESTEQYDPNYEQQYTNNYEDPTMEQYQNNQYAENMYQEQEQVNNINYDNQQPDNANFEYVNSDNIEGTGQNQDENAYNNENDMNDQLQYDNNIPQEYSTVQNEQYEDQQEYIEPEISSNIENKLDTINT